MEKNIYDEEYRIDNPSVLYSAPTAAEQRIIKEMAEREYKSREAEYQYQKEEEIKKKKRNAILSGIFISGIVFTTFTSGIDITSYNGILNQFTPEMWTTIILTSLSLSGIVNNNKRLREANEKLKNIQFARIENPNGLQEGQLIGLYSPEVYEQMKDAGILDEYIKKIEENNGTSYRQGPDGKWYVIPDYSMEYEENINNWDLPNPDPTDYGSSGKTL